MRARLVAGLLVLLLQACASGPTPVSPQAPAASGGAQTGKTPAVTTPDNGAGSVDSGSAVAGLLDEARGQRAAGDLQACFVTLDRALRIAPYSGAVYLEFARSYSAAGNAERAAASAQRGLLYCQAQTCTELRRFAQP